MAASNFGQPWPDYPEISDDEPTDDSSSAGNDVPPPDDPEVDPTPRTYVAIDGIDPDQISVGDKDTLRKEIAELLVEKGYSIESVRIANDEAEVVEFYE